MGRPGLSQNKKFRRLALGLKNSAIARGHLELMWDSAYEAGDEVLGDSLDVELAASWNGDQGILCTLLTETGFIDESEGVYTIHDFWHHAPDYVRKRRARENERRSKVDPCLGGDQSLTGQRLDTDDKTASLPHPHPHPHPHPKELPPTPLPTAAVAFPVVPRGGKQRVLANYPPELSAATTAYKALLRDCKTPEVLNKFPADKRFLAKSSGSNEDIWRAWQARTGCLCQGTAVTDQDMLAAIHRLINRMGSQAMAGEFLAIPMLTTLINSGKLVDALVRVKETSHAS